MNPQRVYPAMSHPTADPAVNRVAARFAGMDPAIPSRARILEIGCATGHHLLPLAMRWPDAVLRGIDTSEEAIRMACDLAKHAGLGRRIRFQACPLEEFDAFDAPYDFIIAHGFFSWVRDELKHHLLDFCARHLAPGGLAVISFNVQAGWQGRMQIVRHVRALQSSEKPMDEMEALHRMKQSGTVTPEWMAIIDDMLAKGPAVLSFDDFAPVNDPWRLDDFVTAAAAAGLTWLGESRVADNRPAGWTAEDEAEASVIRRACSPVELHQWMDERSQRTFRSALLCRADTPLPGRMRAMVALEFALRPSAMQPPCESEMARRIHDALMHDWPSAVRGNHLIERMPDTPPMEIAREICSGILHGRLWARDEPIHIPGGIPAHPALDRLRLACARRRLPVVDAWHIPCTFPHGHYAILEQMDGSLSREGLKRKAAEIMPLLDFDSWIDHLHTRGLLQDGSTPELA